MRGRYRDVSDPARFEGEWDFDRGLMQLSPLPPETRGDGPSDPERPDVGPPARRWTDAGHEDYRERRRTYARERRPVDPHSIVGRTVCPGADMSSGQHAGKGPRGYQRSDERIREDLCDRLTQDGDIDATEIEVVVEDGQVSLRGKVDSPWTKHRAEVLACAIPGVRQVNNLLAVSLLPVPMP